MRTVTSFALLLPSALLTAALLTACGGGGDQSNPGQSAPVVTAPVVAADFVRMARAGSCNELRNRLYIIDQQQVLWDRAGACIDNGYARTLYGALPTQQLCSSADSVAGPRTSCTDESKRTQFDLMVKNIELADLGLGAGHKVERIDVLPADGSTLGVDILWQSAFTAIDDERTVVLKDTTAFEALWNEGHLNLSSIHLPPKIDFTRKMVVGVFTGKQKDGCRSVTIGRVGAVDGKLAVEYDLGRVADTALCIPQFTSPGVLAVIDRYDAPVQFSRIAPQPVAFTRIATSLNATPPDRPLANIVVKDAAAWAQIWTRYSTAGAPLPAVDFGRSMVLFAFYGVASVCDGNKLDEVARVDGKLYVTTTVTPPDPAALCVAVPTARGAMVTVERSDAPVVFVGKRLAAPTI